MQGLLFHRWGLKVLRGPLTGQVLWAALLVPHFLGLLPRLVRGGSHTMSLALSEAQRARQGSHKLWEKCRSGGPEA